MASRSRASSPQTAARPAGGSRWTAEPPRAGGVERPHITDIQRARIVAAITEVCAERGSAHTTVAHVVARSGVSRRTFYELFEDREDCYLAALDEALALAVECVRPAYDAGGDWRERIRLALAALLRFFDEHPSHGRLLVVDALSAGDDALLRRREVLARVIATVDRGRDEGRAASTKPPPLTAEGTVGAVAAVVHARMLEDGGESLVSLTAQLMAMIVLPYAGAGAARRELDRALPANGSQTNSEPPNPLAELNMRLTYRTIRVLLAIGARPGASNREVGNTAGISDPGQISKLLARLRALGLIHTTGPGRARGEPNAWRLTGRGKRVERALAVRATPSI